MYSNPNDCKVKKFRPGQLQNYFIDGRIGNFFHLTEDLKLHETLGMSVNEFNDYLDKLPERTAEEVLELMGFGG